MSGEAWLLVVGLVAIIAISGLMRLIPKSHNSQLLSEHDDAARLRQLESEYDAMKHPWEN
jgi:hypothetical protein